VIKDLEKLFFMCQGESFEFPSSISNDAIMGSELTLMSHEVTLKYLYDAATVPPGHFCLPSSLPLTLGRLSLSRGHGSPTLHPSCLWAIVIHASDGQNPESDVTKEPWDSKARVVGLGI
jgi:hypothetical protein